MTEQEEFNQLAIQFDKQKNEQIQNDEKGIDLWIVRFLMSKEK